MNGRKEQDIRACRDKGELDEAEEESAETEHLEVQKNN